MAENRLTREVENREASKRKSTWKPAAILPEPNPVPGWKFKYIRISVMGQNDHTNVSSMFREGWEPVKASDHPEVMHQGSNDPRFKDNIEIGGLLLCKAPEEMVQSRRDYFENLNRQNMEAIDNNFMREKDNRSNMTMFADRKSTTTFGRGSR
jgi:hypothetical protein